MSETMNNGSPSKRSDAIAEEAADYLVALQTPDANTKSEFIDWLKVSPEHVTEFLAVASLWDSLPETSAQPALEELVQLAAGEQNVVALGQDWSNLIAKPGELAVPQLAQESMHGSSAVTPSSAGDDLDQQYSPGEIAQGRRRSGPVQVRKGSGRLLQATRTRRLWATAASVLLTIAAAALYVQGVERDVYTTAVGEQRSVQLEDGSLISLNTQSSVRVDYSDAFRVIHLTEGEALFEVARDASRPFRVISGSAVIQAVGTQFNVRSVAEEVTVTVVEGIVDVSAQRPGSPSGQVAQPPAGGGAAAIEPIRLTVGQQARVQSGSGQVAVIEVPAVENALAWQQRRLVFEYLPLKEVIDEFNRYNDPPIVIDDPELRNLPISGVFRANDRESFVQFLARMKLAEAQTRGDGTIVLRRVSGER